MLLGEAEILGQVREAYRFAHEQGATGPVLNRLFQGALEVGSASERKRSLARGRCPWLPLALKLAGTHFWQAERAQGAGIGGQAQSGEQKWSRKLRDRGIAQLHVMNRSRDRADELAKQFRRKRFVGGWGRVGCSACNRRMWWCRRSARKNRSCGARSSSERWRRAENRALF